MAPLIPVLFILLIPILLLVSVLIVLGTKAVESANTTKKYLGILSLVGASILVIAIGSVVFEFFQEDDIDQTFVGRYKSIADQDSSNTIELIITESNYSISEDSNTNCTAGTWETGLADEGYLIEFTCAGKRTLGQYYLKDNQLVTSTGEAKFIRMDSLISK